MTMNDDLLLLWKSTIKNNYKVQRSWLVDRQDLNIISVPLNSV